MKTKNSENFDFYYGSMGSGKTAMLLMKYYNCTKDNGIPVLLLKPSIDDRYGENLIQSRIGISAEALVINKVTDILKLVSEQKETPHIIMLDEVQFLLPYQIEQLKDLADNHQIAVDAYGLKINFRGNLFGEETGSIKKVLEVCNHDIHIKSYCACGDIAGNVARYDPETWRIQIEGPEILIGGNNKYISLCYKHWKSGVIPRPSRVRLFEMMINEELDKGKDADKQRMIELKSQIQKEKEIMLEEDLNEAKNSEKIAKRKIRAIKTKLVG